MLVSALYALLLLILARPSLAEEEPGHSQEYEFDIPRTTRVMALHELSRQAGGLLLGYLSTSTVEEETLVGPVKGRLEVEDVLRVVLRQSQLTYRWVENTMLSVEPLPPTEADAELNSTGVVRTLPHSYGFDPSQVEEPDGVVVMGWPIKDIALSGQPVVVVERSDIDALPASTLPDVLKYISQSAYVRPESYRTSGAQYAEMRGLGPDTALILINGRRAFPSANSLASSAFDLNTIPVTAVDRIEFLLDSASAPYGTDAIGGVINIILREHVSAPTLEYRYAFADGGAKEQRVTFAGGLDGDDYHGTLMFDYHRIGELLGQQRDLWRDQNFTRFGGRDLRTNVSNPGNITSLDGDLPGLNEPFAAVPRTDDTPGVSVDDFQATQGQSNLESLLRFSSIVPESLRKTATATGSRRLGDSITAFGELLYVKRESRYQFAPALLPGLPVPAATPLQEGMPVNTHNPFGVPVLAYRLMTEFPPQYRAFESDLRRWVLGLQGPWRRWEWEVTAMHSDEQATTWLGNTLDMPAVFSALGNPDPNAETLNPFTSGPIGSDSLLSGLRQPRYEDRFTSGGKQFAGFIQGPLWRATAVLGAEWRNETMTSRNQKAGEFDPTSSFDTHRDVMAGFAQLRLPLIGEGSTWRAPGMQELTLTAGARWDEYSDYGSDWRFQGALLWKPHNDFNVRISGSESYRPPSLYELRLPHFTTVATIADPKYGVPATIEYISGGNPDLKAATATSFTAGLLYSPDTKNNWKISADRWRIDMKDRQVSVPLQTILGNEAFFASRILRDPDTDLLRSVDTSRMNVGGVSASGVDLTIKMDMLNDLGRFTPGLQVTWFDKYRSTDVPGQPPVDRVNIANEDGSILEWRAIASLRWRRGPFGGVLFARYTPRYDDAIAGVRTGRKIAAQTLFDVQGSLDFGMLSHGESRLRGLKMWLGASNLLNAEPSFANVGDALGFDNSQAELKQRVIYLRLEQKF